MDGWMCGWMDDGLLKEWLSMSIIYVRNKHTNFIVFDKPEAVQESTATQTKTHVAHYLYWHGYINHHLLQGHSSVPLIDMIFRFLIFDLILLFLLWSLRNFAFGMYNDRLSCDLQNRWLCQIWRFGGHCCILWYFESKKSDFRWKTLQAFPKNSLPLNFCGHQAGEGVAESAYLAVPHIPSCWSSGAVFGWFYWNTLGRNAHHTPPSRKIEQTLRKHQAENRTGRQWWAYAGQGVFCKATATLYSLWADSESCLFLQDTRPDPV